METLFNTPPVIQIVMAAYNTEAYITEAIESLRTQTYPYWRLTIINDGSRDDTGKEARQQAKEDTRISVISQENKGLSQARNRGLEHGRQYKCPYTLFFDSDDIYEKDALALMYYTAARLWPAPVVSSNSRPMAQNSRIFDYDTQGRDNSVRHMDAHVETLSYLDVLDRTDRLGCPGTWLVRTKNAEAIGGFDESLRYVEDVDFILRLLAPNQPLPILYTDTVRYRHHPTQQTNNLAENKKYGEIVWARHNIHSEYPESSK